jgi:ribulose-phosphate 3-epimerase
VEDAGADLIHVDVMDGHFVPNLTMGPVVVRGLDKLTELPLDVHFMVEHPLDFVEPFAESGADYLTVHVECEQADEALEEISQHGVQKGISLNPETPPESLIRFLETVDLVLVMSVHPGFGAQEFIESNLGKVRWLSERRQEEGHSYSISIDGGISAETAARAARAGADILVAGSGIFGRQRPGEALRAIRNRAAT